MRRATATLLLAPLLICAGCGYSVGLRLPAEGRSLGIEIFDNEGPLPNVERPLHDEMTRSARNLVTGEILDPAQADLVIVGRIVRYERRSGLRTSGNRLRETGLRIAAQAELWDRTRGRRVRGPVTSAIDVGYMTGDTPGPQDEARARALKNVSDGLLLQLFGERPRPPE